MGLADKLDPMNSLWDWLAFDVRRYRLEAGLSQPQLGKIMGCAKQTVNNVEAGLRPPTEWQCRELDKHFATKGHFHRILTYARLNHDPDWFRQYTAYEARASMLKIYEGQLVPGLLQTPDYARVCLLAGRIPDLDAAVAARMARQEILTGRDAAETWVLIDEAVLHRRVGGADIMRAQLARLVEIADVPHVTIRVIPWSAGAHQGMDGAFKVITVREGDVAFVEAPNGGRLILPGSEVRAFAVRYDRIGAKALPEDSSRSLLARLMESMK
ncbi:MAG: transcriptional regulator, family [Streptosporangiaceae bacterium]|nr:transcriptional regulator, family [Streptosporangiaceae bacterium]